MLAMATSPDTDDSIEGLLEQRTRFEQWLAKLDGTGDKAPAAARPFGDDRRGARAASDRPVGPRWTAPRRRGGAGRGRGPLRGGGVRGRRVEPDPRGIRATPV